MMETRIKKEQCPSIMADNEDEASSLTEISKKEYKFCLPPEEQDYAK